MKRILLILTGLLAAGCAVSSGGLTNNGLDGPAREKAFVQEVTVGTEYVVGTPYVSRWATKPSISVYNGTPADNAFVEQLTVELNEILKPARFTVKYRPPNDPSADIKVIFAPKKEFPDIAKMRMFEYVSGNRGFFYIWYSLPGHVIQRAVVLIDTGLKGKQRQHFIREEVTQSLGPGSDSALFKDSMFYAKGSDGGRAAGFSRLDRKLLVFLYKYLRPGDDMEAVRRKLDENWNNLEVF